MEKKYKLTDEYKILKDCQKDTELYSSLVGEAGYKWKYETKTLEKLAKTKFDPKTFKPFDRVLARIDGGDTYCWFADFVSIPMIEKYDILPCIMSNKDVEMIIPYNEDTKHLVGTTDEAPEYYRYWED